MKKQFLLCCLTKDSDSVSHNIIRSKCTKSNIANSWFKRYVQNRTYPVFLSNTLPNELNVVYGVP